MSAGLSSSLASIQPSIIGKPALDVVVELNRLKRGLADLEQDCDSAIRAIQTFVDDATVNQYSVLEMSAVAYSITFLCQHEEYSMREYALHGLNRVLRYLRECPLREEVNALAEQLETQIVRVYLVTVKDELVLKTVL